MVMKLYHYTQFTSDVLFHRGIVILTIAPYKYCYLATDE